MREVPQQVANWLYNVLQPQYVNKQVTYTHIIRFLQLHLEGEEKFRVRTLVYTYPESGEQALLLNLTGSLKTEQQIAIPLEIWIPLRYPYEDGVPIIYVKPEAAKGWALSPGNHVDGQGRVYHPYLSRWYSECNSFNQSSLRAFNLLELVNIFRHVFADEQPLYRISIEDQTPSLQHVQQLQDGPPPKPSKVPEYESEANRQSTAYGRSIPGVPLKYQGPPPLPHEIKNIAPPPHQRQVNDIDLSQDTVNAKIAPYGQSQAQKVDIDVDLIDSTKAKESDVASKQAAQSQLFKTDLAQSVAKAVRHLHEAPLSRDILVEAQKINSLHSQLAHHRQRANANQQILLGHQDYLSQKVRQIATSNGELRSLDELNSNLATVVYLNPKYSIPIDDIVLADLPLVTQFYQTVAEIKAAKDSLNLLCGNFKSEKEMVSDTNLEWCMKSARSLGRDLFWLESIKQDIAIKAAGSGLEPVYR